MFGTNQRKLVLCMAVALVVGGALAADAQARPEKGRNHRAKRTQRGGEHRGREQRGGERRGREQRRTDSKRSGLSISFSLGGHQRSVMRQRHVSYVESYWVPPVYVTRYDSCGRSYRVVIREGFWQEVRVAGPRPMALHGAGCHDCQPRSGIRVSGSYRF